MSGWHHSNANWKNKTCPVCKETFIPRSGVNKLCSQKCYRKWRQKVSENTEKQYGEISGNWDRYASRLLYAVGKKRVHLSKEIILEILEKQNYKCAISGHPLTCEMTKGKINYTNASIDRIVAGSEYTKENIQIVCRIVNIMKWTLSVEELKEWCRRILNGTEEKSL